MNDLRQFYIIYPLGLVAQGMSELQAKWASYFNDKPLTILSVDEGGILIEAPLYEALHLNLILKTPTRILLRIAEFKARDFPKLFQKISKINWRDYLIGQIPEVEASATNSRLFDSRKIEKAVSDGIKEAYISQPIKKRYQDYLATLVNLEQTTLPKIYYRAVDDTITLSLDTTGELLHKRGEKTLTGLAPIRESLASLLTIALSEGITPPKLKTLGLIDPMSGSGTFLIEAHNYNRLSNNRDFAFFHTPLYLDFLNKPEIKKELLSRLDQNKSSLFRDLIGHEINAEIVSLSQKNKKEMNITFYQDDLFSNESFDYGENLVIINPPYGIRVGQKEGITVMYYHDIISRIFEKFNPLRIGIIIPDEYKFNPKNKSLIKKISFKNGGIPVSFFILE